MPSFHSHLSDEELRAIGLVTVHWSVADNALSDMLASLSRTSPENWAAFLKCRLITFDRRRKECERLLTKQQQQYPQHSKIGRQLLKAGKRLAHRRKIATHWLPTVDAPSGNLEFRTTSLNNLSSGTYFDDMASIYFENKEPEYWSLQDLLSLADDILLWSLDLSMFNFRLLVDGPLSSHAMCIGPKPKLGPLEETAFRSLAQSHQTPDLRTPSVDKC